MAEQPHSQPLVPFERETSWQRAHQGCSSAQPPPRVPEDLSRLFFPSPVMGTAFLPKPTPVPVGRGARQVRVRAAPALPAIPAAPQLPKPDTLFPAPETRRDKQDARDNSSSGKKKKVGNERGLPHLAAGEVSRRGVCPARQQEQSTPYLFSRQGPSSLHS